MADIKKAFLVSLYNKEPYRDWFEELAARNQYEIIASGGTANWCESLGIECRTVEEAFGISPRLDGKVKTLQPDIYTAIMASSREELPEGVPLIVGVCIDLTPPEASGEDDFGKVDIGGVGLLRAAAKSYKNVEVIASPQAARFVSEKYPLAEADRKQLAALAIEQTLRYDKHFLARLKPDIKSPLADRLSLEPVRPLRYGENPAQSAYIGADLFSDKQLPFSQLSGAGLSYTNCLDLESVALLVRPAQEYEVGVVKHTNPTGWAIGSDGLKTVKNAWQGDPKSAYGGFMALNKQVDLPLAEQIVGYFLEGVVAPSFTAEALEKLKERERLRVIAWPADFKKEPPESLRTFAGDFYLCQNTLPADDMESNWKVVSKRRPSEKQLVGLKRAWGLCRHVTSNCAVIAGEDMVYGVGAGQQSRVDAVELAVTKYKRYHDQSDPLVLASDGFFPFPDNIEIAAAAGVDAVIAPGGSIRDEEVIAAADKNDIVLLFASERVFKH
jgi:phosphoribosylaminoimidazolecarboxamide formyltransferase/IMP cyclohydrolase